MLARLTIAAASCAVLPALWACGGASGAQRGDEGTEVGYPGEDGAGTSGAPDEDGRAPTAAEQHVIDDLSRIAERVRDLELLHPVQVRIQDRAAIVGYLTAEIEDDDLERSREVYVALGLLSPDLDIRDLLERVLGEQVVGYYDPKGDRLVIRDDVMRALSRGETRHGIDESRVTIVHELVHAIQDQRLELGVRFSDDEERDTDPDAAFHAVVEGDATLAMLGYLAESAGQRLERLTENLEMLRGMMGNAPAISDAELAQAPPILRVTLVSSYIDGVLFAAELHGLGGWRAVDAAHRTPPTSTEQILHPDRFVHDEQPEPITLPAFAELEASGLTVVEEDTLGELEMKVYLGQLSEDGVDESAADGWSGDRLRVYRGADATAGPVVWFTTWDDEAEAREAEAAARRIGASLSPDARAANRVLRHGRALLIVRNLAPALHDDVKVAFESFATALPAGPAQVARRP